MRQTKHAVPSRIFRAQPDDAGKGASRRVRPAGDEERDSTLVRGALSRCVLDNPVDCAVQRGDILTRRHGWAVCQITDSVRNKVAHRPGTVSRSCVAGLKPSFDSEGGFRGVTNWVLRSLQTKLPLNAAEDALKRLGVGRVGSLPCLAASPAGNGEDDRGRSGRHVQTSLVLVA